MKVKNRYGRIETCQCYDEKNKEIYLKSFEECPILPKKCKVWRCGLNEEIPFKYRKGFKNFIFEVKRLNNEVNFEGIATACMSLDAGDAPEEAYKKCCEYLDSSAQASWVLFQIYNLSIHGDKFKKWFNKKHDADPNAPGLVSMCQLPLTYLKKHDQPSEH